MREHFFTKEEVMVLFKDFSDISVERIVRTYNDETICDNDYIVLLKK